MEDISRKQELYQLLFDMLEKIGGQLNQKIWEVLKILPVNKDLQELIEGMFDGEKEEKEEKENKKWQNIFKVKECNQLIYNM